MNTKAPKTILVSGVGAIIGYGIVRSLRQSNENIRIIGMDIFSDAIGQYWCDAFKQALRTDHQDYASFLQNILSENQVDLFIPGIEQDVLFLAENKHHFSSLNSKIAINDLGLISLAHDKWLFYQELLKHPVPLIPSVIQGSFDEIREKFGVPFIIKPRRSYASKGLRVIENKREFDFFQQELGYNFMAQPIIGQATEEYTSAVFGDGLGNMLAHISFRRRLSSEGSTNKAEVVNEDFLTEQLRLLTSIFKPIGPCNLQFRCQSDEYYLLEINPRISSSTSLRTAFGYNEAKFCMDFYLDGKTIRQPPIRQGRAIRYIEDFIVS